jgi:hypothetical protein
MNEVAGSCEIIDFKPTQARMPVPQFTGFRVAQAFLPVLVLIFSELPGESELKVS